MHALRMRSSSCLWALLWPAPPADVTGPTWLGTTYGPEGWVPTTKAGAKTQGDVRRQRRVSEEARAAGSQIGMHTPRYP